MQAQALDWQHIILQALLIVVPIIGAGYLAYRRLWWTLQEFRPHTHAESEGVLKAEGIRYPRTLNGG